MNGSTRVLLVLLRLAIGWHFLFEGVEKIRSVDLIGQTETNRPWSSAAYLREATGPAGDFFRQQAGDPDQEALQLLDVKPVESGADPARVPPHQRISPALDKAWNEYSRRFADNYRLSAHQRDLAEMKLRQAKDQAVRWLLGGIGARDVERSFFGAAAVRMKETPLERLNVYRDKVRQLQQTLNEKLPAFGRDVERQRLRILKAEVNRLRSELLTDLERPLTEALASVLTDDQRKTGPLTAPPHVDLTSWNRTDWINAITRYGLTAVGACLLLGLFTRSACVGGAFFLLLFYLAMPALPGVPDNPRSEGHYLFINKNIIEMLALLALATTPSGRWAGVDGLLYCLAPWRRRSRSPVISLKN